MYCKFGVYYFCIIRTLCPIKKWSPGHCPIRCSKNVQHWKIIHIHIKWDLCVCVRACENPLTSKKKHISQTTEHSSMYCVCILMLYNSTISWKHRCFIYAYHWEPSLSPAEICLHEYTWPASWNTKRPKLSLITSPAKGSQLCWLHWTDNLTPLKGLIAEEESLKSQFFS